MTFVIAKDPKKRVAEQNRKKKKTTTKITTVTLQQQQQLKQQQTTQQQQHQTTQSLITIQKISRTTTATNVRNSRRFESLIPTMQTTEKSNRICQTIQVWQGLFKKKSFE